MRYLKAVYTALHFAYEHRHEIADDLHIGIQIIRELEKILDKHNVPFDNACDTVDKALSHYRTHPDYDDSVNPRGQR